MALNIEVGKAYRSRAGKKVTVVSAATGSAEWPFAGDNCCSYRPNGQHGGGDAEWPGDLIAEWSEPATPDADGWITWAGGECPVPLGTCVDIRLRDGVMGAENSSFVRWNDTAGEGDIVAYRIVSVDKNPSPDADGWIAHVPGAPQPFEDMQMVEWDNGKRTGRMLAGDLMWDVSTSMKRYRAARIPATPPAAPNAAPWPPEPAPLPVTMEPDSALDVQVGGDHYRSMKIQPIEYIHANGIPFAEGTVIKYVSRHRSKGGLKDLEKARHVLDLLIELERKREGGAS